jgi:uncharacterized glyoxalase superfamily protein PhnB
VSAAGQMQTVAPFLLVRNVKAAAAYYSDKLGFSAPSFWGDPPLFTIVRRDGVAVMLRQVRADESFQPNAALEDCLDAYFRVKDADALYNEFAASGAALVCPPEDQPYMMREFQVRDLDGHLLIFAHDISEQGGAHG